MQAELHLPRTSYTRCSICSPKSVMAPRGLIGSVCIPLSMSLVSLSLIHLIVLPTVNEPKCDLHSPAISFRPSLQLYSGQWWYVTLLINFCMLLTSWSSRSVQERNTGSISLSRLLYGLLLCRYPPVLQNTGG